jgi:CheY-like chemotaxis protein
MALTGKRVLVVEDEAMAAMLLEDVLGGLGCEVVAVVARLDVAEQQAQTATIDVALLDVNLVGQLSYPVAVILRSRNIPFVFSTGYRRIALPAGLQDAVVLSKPYSRFQLANALLRSLGKNATWHPGDPRSAAASG